MKSNHCQRKEDKTDSSNEFCLKPRSKIGEGVKSEQMPMDADTYADTKPVGVL